MKIYVASSWRNTIQPKVVRRLRRHGHKVYDFRHPRPGDRGFRWSEVDLNWTNWTPLGFAKGLRHPIAEKGFRLDWQAMQECDACVLVMPCGRSAHLEAGYFVGASKKLFILLDGSSEPELMYKMATHVACSMDELMEIVDKS